MLRHTLAIVAGIFFVAGNASAGFYCWTDKDGNKACGNSVPPEYSKQDRAVMNNQGQQVKILPHEKTEAERAEDLRKLKQAQLDKQAAADDRFLLQTYSSVEEIEHSRNERLALIDSNIKISQASAESDRKTLAGLNTRKADAEKGGKKAPDYVSKQIAEFERRVAADDKNIASQQSERQAQSAKFERDIARYRQLKGLPPAAPAASTAAAAATPAPSAPNQAANAGVGK